MTASLLIRDVGAFSVQITALVLAGAVVAQLCSLRQPRTMLVFWRVLLFACLAIPFCQSWDVASPQPAPSAIGTRAEQAPAFSAPGVPLAMRASTSRLEPLLVVLLGGIVLRAGWLLMGAAALRRLRREAMPLSPVPGPIREAQARVATRSEILISDRASGPMTFGMRRPIILLPIDVGAMPPHVQEAMAYHELIHVRRHDWVAEILEEAVRTILWFQPAVWWLIGRIRLVREQVVDEAVIQLTEAREQYVDALLVVALRKCPFTFAPAPTFLRRSLLKRRVEQIMQETTMTTYRLVASLTTSAVAVAVTAVFVVRSFPMQAQGPAQAQAAAGAPVQVVKGGENLIHGGVPEYPGRVVQQQIAGDVVMDVAVDERGEVADARVLTGPDEFRRSALESVLRWHYVPTAVSNRSVQVVLRFQPPAPEAANDPRVTGAPREAQPASIATQGGRAFSFQPSGKELDERSSQERVEHVTREMEEALNNPQTTPAQKDELKQKLSLLREEILKRKIELAAVTNDGSWHLARVRTERFPERMAFEILSKAGLSVGNTLSKESLERLQNVATETDEHIKVEVGREETGDVVLTFIMR